MIVGTIAKITGPVAVADGMPEALLAEWSARWTPDPAVLFSTPAGAIYRQAITPQPVAATTIRAQLAHGAAGRQAVAGSLPPAVLSYIDQHRLYLPRPDAT